jgi:hypothetical protein
MMYPEVMRVTHAYVRWPNRTMHPKCFGLMVVVLACCAKWCAGADESRYRLPSPPEINFGPEAKEDTEMAASV